MIFSQQTDEGPLALSYGPVPIAVVGMACRLPGNSNSPHALWDLLRRSRRADNTIPLSRFRQDTHYNGSSKPETLRSVGSYFLENIKLDEFDAAFFNIPRPEAVSMDPQQRQLLEVVYECLENAGVPLDAVDGERVGCFVGSFVVGKYMVTYPSISISWLTISVRLR